MSSFGPWVLGLALSCLIAMSAAAQEQALDVPAKIAAGDAFSIPTTGSGNAVLYIVGPAQVLKRDVQLGLPIALAAGDLTSAGHYLAVLSSVSSTATAQFDVLPSTTAASLSFLARPSRLPVDLQNGITGAVYVFDSYRNLITSPSSVDFQLSVASAPAQTRTVSTSQGAAWTEMNSASREGNAKFVAHVGDVSATRVIQQVPGNPCNLTMTAHQAGNQLDLATNPVLDCSGNPVTDGTVVTFTESWSGGQTTVDVPLKHDVARTEVPALPGARISVASGVILGNEIRWEGRE